MAGTISFEVYAYKSGNWNIDSVYDDKEQALHEARLLLESRHLTGVKVIQERHDEESGKVSSMIIFNEVKHVGKPKTPPPARKKKPEAGRTADKVSAVKKKKGKSDPIHSFIKLVLILGGICLGLIALVAFYVTTFS